MSAKTIIRNSAARLLLLMGITAPRSRANRRFSIVTFHRVLPSEERNAYPYPGLVVTPQELDEFLRFFAGEFDCGPLATQHRRYLSGEVTARPLLAITFDDGQYDNHLHARPILAHHQIKASFFIPVLAVEKQEPLWHDRLGFALLALLNNPDGGVQLLRERLAAAGLQAGGRDSLIGNTVAAAKRLALAARLDLVSDIEKCAGMETVPEFARLMDFHEIAQLAATGHEIGSHSMTHCLMPECDDAALAYELGESRRVLEERLACPVESFCYPNGDADSRTARAVAEAGYRCAVTTAWGSNGLQEDEFLLRRYDMDAAHACDTNGKLVSALIAWRMSGLYPGLG